MRILLPMMFFALAACTNKGAEAEEKYRMVERQFKTFPESYRYKQLCPQSKEVAQAYLDQKNEEKYSEWSLRAGTDCSFAEMLP